MHEKQAFTFKNRAAMIRTTSSKQLTIAEFDWPFETALDKNNRWVKLGECIPWDELAESYYQGLPADRGRPLKDARLVIGAVIIKHKQCLSDVETMLQIQENPYLQYFVGLLGYLATAPFAHRYWSKSANAWAKPCLKGFIAPLSRRMKAKSLSSLNHKHRLTRPCVPNLTPAQSRKSPVIPQRRRAN
jgi:hypothetical protein